MRDRRSVDDLTIEELEQILRIRKRQARQERLDRLAHVGRRRDDVPLPEEADGQPSPQAGGGKSWRERSLRDKLLLAVEIVAALGLAGIMIFAALTLRDLNQEAAEAQASALAGLPTPTATPIIRAVVLPSGHTPPTSPGGAQPNYSEVPEYLRPLVEQQFAGPIFVPTPAPSQARRIRISAIHVDAPVVQGDGWEQLKQGVAQHIGTGNPGQPGNIVFSAHNDIFGEIFRDLYLLKEGDEIILETLTDAFVYRVLYWDIVAPTEVSVMEPTSDAIVTLISCYPYLVDDKRIVVIAQLVEP